MSIEQIGVLVAIATGLSSLFAIAYFTGGKLARLETKVETMWEFMVKRGKIELLQRGLGEMNSPIKITAEALSWFAPMQDDLKRFYAEHLVGVNENEARLQIERKFSDRLVKEICLPHNLQAAACLIIALVVAKGEDKVEMGVEI